MNLQHRKAFACAAAFLLIILLGLTPVLGAPQSRDEIKLTGVLKTDYFTIRYDPSDPYLAKVMADSAQEALQRVSKDLGYKPKMQRPFFLNIYPTHYEFIHAGGLKARKFTVGTTSSWDETISVDASGVLSDPAITIAHEVTHAIIFRHLGPTSPALPLWVNEGLAKYESGGLSGDDKQLIVDAAANGSLLPLSYLNSTFPNDRTDLAYAESCSAVTLMIKQYGKSSPRILLRELENTGSLNRAMHKATGKTAAQFESDWYNYTTKRYWLVKLTRIVTAVTSAIMAVLVVIAFIVRRKQKLEQARRWEQEEFEEAIRRQLGNDWWR
ncbi:MAG: peptidase MA family metallohydrolase [Armatimonadota bacterium]|nr:hypothetical protein [bacterium]